MKSGWQYCSDGCNISQQTLPSSLQILANLPKQLYLKGEMFPQNGQEDQGSQREVHLTRFTWAEILGKLRLPNDGCAAEESPFCPANNPPLNRCLTSTAVLTEQLKYRSGSFCKFPPKRLTGGLHERGKKKAADSIFPMSAIVSKPVEKMPSWEKKHFKSIPTSIQKALLTTRMKFYRGDPCNMAFKCTDESKLWYGISHRGSSLPCSFAQKQHQL